MVEVAGLEAHGETVHDSPIHEPEPTVDDYPEWIGQKVTVTKGMIDYVNSHLETQINWHVGDKGVIAWHSPSPYSDPGDDEEYWMVSSGYSMKRVPFALIQQALQAPVKALTIDLGSDFVGKRILIDQTIIDHVNERLKALDSNNPPIDWLDGNVGEVQWNERIGWHVDVITDTGFHEIAPVAPDVILAAKSASEDQPADS